MMTGDAEAGSREHSDVSMLEVRELDNGLTDDLTPEAKMARVINFLNDETHKIEEYELMLKMLRKLLSSNTGKKLDIFLENVMSGIGSHLFDVLAKFLKMTTPIDSFVYELSWSLCNIAATNSEEVLSRMIHYSVLDDQGNKVYLFVNYMSRTL